MLSAAESLTETLTLDGPVTAQCDFSVSEALLAEDPEVTQAVYAALSQRLPQVWPTFVQETRENTWMAQALVQNKPLAFSILLVTNDEIHHLNRTFRQKDQPTDVLTFTLLNDADPAAGWQQLPQWELGDVYISLPWAKNAVSQAQCNENAAIAPAAIHFFPALTLYIIERMIHGILHLLGMHHDTMSAYNKVIAIQTKVIHGQSEPV